MLINLIKTLLIDELIDQSSGTPEMTFKSLTLRQLEKVESNNFIALHAYSSHQTLNSLDIIWIE